MPTEKEMLTKARKFVLLERDRHSGQAEIALEWRGEEKWAIVIDRMGIVLDKDLNLLDEPLPSGRSDEFLARTRFDLKTAWMLAEQFIKTGMKGYVR